MEQNMDEKSPAARAAHQSPPGPSTSYLPKQAPRAQVQRYIVMEYEDPVYNPGAIPRTPLRVPRKNPRRSMPPAPHPGAYVPTSPASTHESTRGERDSSFGEPDGDGGATPPEADVAEEKQWFAQRKRSRRFLVFVGIVTVLIIVGLGVGLSLGLRYKVSTQGSQADDADDLGRRFPAGEFSFSTSIQKNDSSCTSRSTTWNCEPMTLGASTTFDWEIKRFDDHTYTITSKGNAFAMDFTNVSMSMQDYNKPTERLEFSLYLEKTVTPSDAGSTTNRAAKCSYKDTKLDATLFTRKRGSAVFNPPKYPVMNAAWPGDVEIVQSLKSTIGQPVCQDAKGRQIADVGTGLGTCECLYSNAESQ